jgi:Cu(I)/Ag(I) efflux system membrane fusion protein
VIVLIAVGLGYGLRIWQSHEAKTEAAHQHEEAKAAPAPAKKPAKVQIWTCSMHPQIRMTKPGNCPICGMKLIPLVTSGDERGSLRELAISEDAAKLMAIETTLVERRFVTAKVRMVGKIDYDETRISDITAWVPGRLDRLFVDYTGVPVKKGDHMVSLYSPDLLSAQEELLQALKTVSELKNSNVGIVVETANATVEAAREKLRLWGLTADQIKQIEQRGKPDDHMTIYAPEGGIVVNKNAQQGMYVKTGTRIYTIADLSQVWVNLDAYESDLSWLRYGQHVEFTTEAYPGETFAGTISFIHPVLDEATRTVKVRVNVANPDGRLKPGMFVRAIVKAKVATGGRVMDPSLAGKWICPMHPDVVKDGLGTCDVCGMPLVRAESLGFVGAEPDASDKPLVIPTTAALLTGKRAIVYVEKSDQSKPTFEGREIVLGPRAGDYYIVRRGLAEGERVVTKGNFKLDAELQIQAKPSMMTPETVGGERPKGKNGEPEEPQLPPLVEHQLREVAAAAKSAIEASAGTDLAKAQAAYRMLRDRTDLVDAKQLTGEARKLWREYAMLIGDDGEVGATLKTLTEAQPLAKTTANHIHAMQTKLGLKLPAETAKLPPVSPAFKQQLGGIVDGYLGIQAALAKDDPAAAKKAAEQGLLALGKVDMELVSGPNHMAWMKLAGELKTLLGAVAKADGIKALRAKFALLSEQVTALVTRFGVPSGTLYKAWCPMAFDGRGAFWIQPEKDIHNPYFGAAMPSCGEVKEVLK